ncbi:MAG: thermonuclease family protein [Burkholderiaceae bacterium]
MRRSVGLWLSSLLLAACAAAPTTPSAPSFEAVAERVVSGDTLIIRTPEGPLELRLADIGAPQANEFHAPASRTLLVSMVEGRTVTVTLTGREGASRAFGYVVIGRLNVNLELVRRAAAWVCWEYALSTDYMPFENRVRRLGEGVWISMTELEARLACRARPPGTEPVGGAPR